MVTFKMISKKGNIIHYEYYPMGNEKYPGTFIFDYVNMKMIKREYSKNDTKHASYYNHFLNNIKSKNGEYLEKGLGDSC